VVAEILSWSDGSSIHDGVGEGTFGGEDVACRREGLGLATVVVDQGGRRDDGAKDVLCSRVAGDDAALGCIGDDDTDGDGVEDGLKARLATAQGFRGFFVFIDIFEGSVPARDLSIFVSPRGGTGPHPAPETIRGVDTVFDVQKTTCAKGFFPRLEGREQISRMKSADPSLSQRLLFREAGQGMPALVGFEDHAIGLRGPWDLRVEFDGVAVVVFAFSEGPLGFFAASDVDDGDGDADDLVDLVAGRLIGDEEGAEHAGLKRVWRVDFDVSLWFSAESQQQVGLALGELRREDFAYVAAEVGGDRNVMHLGETLVDADVTEVAI
jgi:hypothetical protein